MKLTKLVFLFSLAIATVSCSKNDDDNAPDPYTLSTTNFVDSYKMKFLEIKEVETITFGNGTTSTSTSTKVGSVFQNVNYAFNSNHTFTATGLYNTVTTVTDTGGTSTVGDPVIVSLNQSGTYTLNIANSTLTITDDEGESSAFEIKDYTETGMTLYSENTTLLNNSSTKTTTEYRFSR